MRRFVRRLTILALATAARGVHADNPNQDGLPLFAGDLSVANQIVHGSANVMLVGDSIMADIGPSYATQWHPDRWSGVVLAPTYAFGQYILSSPYVSSSSLRSPLSAAGPAGLTTTAPGGQVESVFNGSAAPATDTSPGTLAGGRYYELGLDSNLGSSVTYVNGAAGNVTLTPMIYANANGAADNTVSMSLRLGAYDQVGMLPLNGNVTATPTLVGSSITVPKQVWASGDYLTADFRVAAGAAPANGSNLTVAGIRVSDGGPGLQLASIANGGWAVETFLDNTTTPLANVQQYVSLTDTNVTLIALGTNDLGLDDAATFKSRMQQLINRYRSTNAAMKFVLMTTYDTNQAYATETDGTLRQVAFNQDMYQLSQENSGVLFLNLFDKAPDWTTLKASYLSDNVHPNAAGNAYFADMEWGLMNDAAVASVPEPGTATLLIGAMFFGGLRRRPRNSI